MANRGVMIRKNTTIKQGFKKFWDSLSDAGYTLFIVYAHLREAIYSTPHRSLA